MGSFSVWFRGLAAAFIGGGASAVTAGVAAPAINPQAFNFHAQLAPLLQLMGALFVINGGLAVFAYLSKSPLPQAEVTTTKKITDIQPAGEGVKTTVLTQTTKESKDPQ